MPFSGSFDVGTLDGTNGYVFTGSASQYSGGGVWAKDFNGDGFADLVISGGTSNLVYVVFATPANLATLDAADGTTDGHILLSNITPPTGIQITGVSGALASADVNHDGLSDVIIGSSPNAYVVFGTHANANIDATTLNGSNGFTFGGPASTGTVANIGDVNGDGFADFLVGANSASYYSPPLGFNPIGAAYVVFGSESGFPASTGNLDGTNGFRIHGVYSPAYNHIGTSVTGGDINGDGISDIITGASADGSSTPGGRYDRSGKVYVIFGKDTATAGDFPADFVTATFHHDNLDGSNGFILTGNGGDWLGVSVATADVNNDGITDLVAGAFEAGSGVGAAYVLFGHTGGFSGNINVSSLDGTNGFKIIGVAGDHFDGWTVASIGDVNGDGIADIAIGTDVATGPSYVVFGSASGFSAVVDLSTLDGTNGFKINAGTVNASGDLNHDGGADLIVSDSTANGNAGDTYLLFGSAGNNPPVVTASGGTTAALEQIAKAIDSGITVSDSDNTTLIAATVSISDHFQSSQDVLAFTNNGSTMGNIAGHYLADAGVLELTSTGGTATLAQWQAALRAVTYTDTSDTPDTANRTISFIVDDGNSTSAAATKTLSVTAVSDPPSVTTTGGTTATSAQLTVAIDTGITVADIDNTTLASAKVSITGNFQNGQDVLGFVNDGSTMGNISSSYSAGTGVLTLTSSGASATLTQWDAALQAVTYRDHSNGPDTADRTISFTVNDGTSDSAAATKTVSVSLFPESFDATSVDGANGYVFTGTAGQYSGGGIWAPDFNGDGVADLIVNGGASNLVYVVFATPATLATLDAADGTNDGHILLSNVGTGGTGIEITGISGNLATSDVNHDGLSDVIVGSSPNAYVVFGSNAGTNIDGTALDGSNGFTFSGPGSTGSSVANIGDVNGDGFADLLVGAPSASYYSYPVGFNPVGAAYVVFGSESGFPAAVNKNDLDGTNGFRIHGVYSPAYNHVGTSVTGGDLNGDGISDIITGAAADGSSTPGGRYDRSGKIYVIFGKDTATAGDFPADFLTATFHQDNLDGTNGFILTGNPGDWIGFSVSTADVNGDGITDLITGGVHSASDVGTAYVLFGHTGGFSGNISVADLDGTNGFKIIGAPGDHFDGWSVASIGDVNSDGINDIAIGTDVGTGPSYVVFGSANGFAPVIDLSTLDGSNGFKINAGTVNASGDLNNDGRSDLIVSDATANSNAGDTYVLFGRSTNSLPVVTNSGGSTAFTEGNNVPSPLVVVDSGLTVADADNATLASATVSITGNFHTGQDVLAFDNDNETMGNISGSYVAGTGVLALTSSGATATLAEWQAALRAVVYTNSSETPDPSDRTISFMLNDGTDFGAESTKTVTVTAVNDTPVVTASGGTTAATEQVAIAVDGGVTVSDVDSTAFASATVSVTGNFHSGEDVLAFANGAGMGNIAGNYSAGTGILTLTSSGATATLAQWQTALRAVTYTDSSDTPNTSNRTISFVVNDGGSDSSASTKTVSVAAVNDAPVVTASGGTTSANEQVAIAVDGSLTVSDPDNATLASATVSITGGFHSSEDALAFANGAGMGNIAGNYSAGTGILTLTSSGATATLAQWQTALRAVTYTDNSDTPNTSNRTISFVANDGSLGSAASTKTVSVTAVNDTPVVTASGGTTAATEQVAIAVDGGVTVSDVDSTTFASATVSITGNFHSSEDVLAFANGAGMGNISGNYSSGTGVLTLTSSGATATLAQWQTALRAVTYTDSSDAPNTSNRTVSFVVNDGGSDSTASTKTVSVTAVNDAPTLTAPGGTTAASEQVAVVVYGSLSVSDPDNATLASATVSITGGFHSSEDVLAFANGAGMGNIAGNYSSGTGVLTLTSSGATATSAQWQTALRAVTYTDSSDTPNTSDRTVSFVVNDGSLSSTALTRTVSVTAVNDAPVVTASGGTTAATEQVAIAVDSGVTVSDVDNTALASATVSITGHFQSGEDVLAFANGAGMGNIAGNYSAGTGILTLSSSGATATLAQWQTALRAVTYTDSSDTPNTSNRTISFVVNDSGTDSVASTKQVSVTAVDDPGVAHSDAFATPETTAITTQNVFSDNGSGADSDPDSALSVVAVNGLANVGVQVTLASGAHLTLNANGTFAYDPNHVFDSLPAAGSGASNTTATDTFTYTVAGGSTATVTVTISGVDSNDSLLGTPGNDTLDGGTGADTMAGGAGNDVYIVDNVGDVVTENANAGTDEVHTSLASYTLTANVENLTGTVNTGQTLIGNALDNIITGGTGADTMIGGAGNDIYIVDNAGDAVIENANEGTDEVHTSLAAYTLGANVENLIGTVSTGQALTGNSLANAITGGSGNDTLDGGAGADIMAGGAGNDLYIVDNAGDVVRENANEGTDTALTGLATYTLEANVENLTGTVNTGQALTGNALDNVITGGTGADIMAGGAGNDSYFVNNVGDAVVENANEGTDTVYTTISLTLAPNLENLVMQGSADLQGYGNTQANLIFGNAGNNLIDGGAGADAMFGGAGNDVYFADNAGDAAFENPNEGNDSVFTTANFTLGANVENLIMQGSADLQGYGNGDANVIYGNAGNNLIDGGGGADLMVGGAGNDTYFADDPSDSAFEVANEGNDTVFASCSYGIATNVENLILQGTGDFQEYGSSDNNVIYGNSGNNLINGGAGIDLMVGGAGNDTYFVDDPSDSCFEVAGEGSDAVFASCNYGLAANVETLVMQGSGDFQGYGSNDNNTLYGNSGNNLLNGAGGADTMIGGAGNDTYFVDNVGDVVFENVNEGTDAVFASVNYTLTANVEALVLQGGANLSGTGNALANSLFGNVGDNTLDGGAGADNLTGGAGNDTFVFHAGEANGDTVVDFAGNGPAAGDSFQFVGFGTAAGGATFTQIGATNQWQIHSGLDAHNEVITLSNSASVHPTDFTFV